MESQIQMFRKALLDSLFLHRQRRIYIRVFQLAGHRVARACELRSGKIPSRQQAHRPSFQLCCTRAESYTHESSVFAEMQLPEEGRWILGWPRNEVELTGSFWESNPWTGRMWQWAVVRGWDGWQGQHLWEALDCWNVDRRHRPSFRVQRPLEDWQANVSLPIDGHVVPRSNTATQGARADEGLTPAGVEVMG